MIKFSFCKKWTIGILLLIGSFSAVTLYGSERLSLKEQSLLKQFFHQVGVKKIVLKKEIATKWIQTLSRLTEESVPILKRNGYRNSSFQMRRKVLPVLKKLARAFHSSRKYISYARFRKAALEKKAPFYRIAKKLGIEKRYQKTLAPLNHVLAERLVSKRMWQARIEMGNFKNIVRSNSKGNFLSRFILRKIRKAAQIGVVACLDFLKLAKKVDTQLQGHHTASVLAIEMIEGTYWGPYKLATTSIWDRIEKRSYSVIYWTRIVIPTLKVLNYLGEKAVSILGYMKGGKWGSAGARAAYRAFSVYQFHYDLSQKQRILKALGEGLLTFVLQSQVKNMDQKIASMKKFFYIVKQRQFKITLGILFGALQKGDFKKAMIYLVERVFSQADVSIQSWLKKQVLELLGVSKDYFSKNTKLLIQTKKLKKLPAFWERLQLQKNQKHLHLQPFSDF